MLACVLCLLHPSITGQSIDLYLLRFSSTHIQLALHRLGPCSRNKQNDCCVPMACTSGGKGHTLPCQLSAMLRWQTIIVCYDVEIENPGIPRGETPDVVSVF